jgi:hypothetical protein
MLLTLGGAKFSAKEFGTTENPKTKIQVKIATWCNAEENG